MSELSIPELVQLMRDTTPTGGFRTLVVEDLPLSLTRWLRPSDEEWARIRARAAANDEGSRQASNTRVWNRQHNLVGAFAEWAYGELSGLPWNESGELGDGGEDFPGVDVKGTPRWQAPRLLRLATDPLKAPRFALFGVDISERRAQYVGWAMREMLAEAPLVEYGYGPTRTLTEGDLLEGLPT